MEYNVAGSISRLADAN